MLTSGVAGLLAGALSMAAGEYVSVRSQREMYEYQIGLEADELAEYPDEEAEELALIYAARGMDVVQARQLAQTLIKDPAQALDALSREELGINPDDLGSPWGAAIASFVSFAAGATLPLVPFLAGMTLARGTFAAAGLTLLALYAIGMLLSLFTGRNAWLGGLLEHVVSLLTLADKVAAHYPLLDRDLLLTGVVLHDIGKIRELSWGVGFDYTIEGTLLGHIQMGIDLVEKAIAALPGFPDHLRTLVLHMILSHHGKLEFGSPKLPMIPEALVLNFVDDLDAKMQAVQSEFDKSIREGKGPNELTGKVWSLDNRQLLNTRRWLGEEE